VRQHATNGVFAAVTIMYFQHAPEIWRDFPELGAGAVFATGITADASVAEHVARLSATAAARLDGKTESELPEIQAWRRAFAKMGLKPTQYRCASEALLRRFRQEKALPSIHPLVDLCNALSLASAIPVAALDVAKIADHLEVRYAAGNETYLAFSGETEHPQPREVIFADRAGQAHARRWTNRQSARSAVRPETASVLIVAEALHATAAEDVRELIADIVAALKAAWPTEPVTRPLDRASPRFEF
jgi:DNA/RNA-binding domain of Phe-tRNA-synthetase-like protein